MGLNISKGNMYPFISHTWNTIKGICPHNCSYCYMKQFPQNDVRFDAKELKTDLGENNFIFVGSSCDMWANGISHDWIFRTLEHLKKFPNEYLYQSKNPERFIEYSTYITYFPRGHVLGTTIETNRIYPQMGNTPAPIKRAEIMRVLSYTHRTMITVEPVIDCDVDILSDYIKMCNPEWVNIGANSKENLCKLPEPSADKIKDLISNLKDDNIEVKIKNNLKRLMK